jgi:hypothetical protein
MSKEFRSEFRSEIIEGLRETCEERWLSSASLREEDVDRISDILEGFLLQVGNALAKADVEISSILPDEEERGEDD